jgi:formylglycine-generating enzyme required for sulfatase activity
VVGITWDDMLAYATWLRESSRVPGARLCHEEEWIRAARGADRRTFPHGEQVGASDANIDITYGRVDTAFGLDEVGSHPVSASPFGLEDMLGNAFELLRAVDRKGIVARGGAYYFGKSTGAIPNRAAIPIGIRSPTLGFRMCADGKSS